MNSNKRQCLYCENPIVIDTPTTITVACWEAGYCSYSCFIHHAAIKYGEDKCWFQSEMKSPPPVLLIPMQEDVLPKLMEMLERKRFCHTCKSCDGNCSDK